MREDGRPVLDDAVLAARFETHRSRLLGVAYRLPGSRVEADDAVQEAWLRLHRSDATAVQNLRAWLTTVVARVCLDMLRPRSARRELPLDDGDAPPLPGPGAGAGPESRALLADAVGLAVLVVLDALGPAERVAFVLHDMFALPFEEIAPILGRTQAAARQLTSRTRRRVRDSRRTGSVDLAGRRQVVEAFLSAARRGDLE